MLQIFRCISVKASQTIAACSANTVFAQRHEHVACMQALQCLQNWKAEGLSAAQKHLTTAQSELASMSTTSPTSDTPTLGFHPDVNRRLLGPLPPRPVQVSGKIFTIVYNYRSSSNNAGHLL